MQKKLETLLSQALEKAQSAGLLPAFELSNFGLERPADSSNGDWSSTVALRSAKAARMAPAKIAAALVEHMPADASVERVEVAGPGFINFYLSSAASAEVFAEVRRLGVDFGRSNVGEGQRVQVEFVSANPVGPLHIGHGRWAALGDALCRVMSHAGYDITREYYITDHGTQMDVFGSSLSVRVMQLLELMKEGKTLDEARAALIDDREVYVRDEDDKHPETHPLTSSFIDALGGNAYAGDYLVDLAYEFVKEDGSALADMNEEDRACDLRERGYKLMLKQIEQSCHTARCDFDRWFSERSLYERDETGTNAVERAFAALEKAGYLYTTDDGALWFRSTDFGDDKDRVLVKSNGEHTYFASDVAYHWDKFQRVDRAIDIWGADHHGYIKRVDSACEALGYQGQFEVLLGQLVNLLRNGVPVKMSKRSGMMVSFDELLDEVGVDATRYTLVSKSSNQMIDFDIELAKRQDSSNPVYYVQYAHARICSILRRAAAVDEQEAAALGMDAVAQRAIGDSGDLSQLTHPSELQLSRRISEFGELVAGCARDRAPFRLTHYAEELAADFHGFYQNCQVLASEGRPLDEELSHARLIVCDAVRRVLALSLSLIGVSAPEKM